MPDRAFAFDPANLFQGRIHQLEVVGLGRQVEEFQTDAEVARHFGHDQAEEPLRLGKVVHGQRGRRQFPPQPHLILRGEVLRFLGQLADLLGCVLIALADQVLGAGQRKAT